METRLGIIDLGSNTIRMKLLKVYDNGYYNLIDEAKETVRLSEGMGEDNVLTEGVMDKTIYTLKLFKRLIENYRIDNILALATEAVRKATNQKEFLERIKKETDLDFHVITGEQEAYYAYLGVIHTLNLETFVMIDTGGGSTEIAYIENRELKFSASFPFGSVVLTERFFKEGGSKSSLKNLEQHIYKELKGLPWLMNLKNHNVPIVGLGGAIRSLAKINKKEIGFPLDNLHNYHLSKEEVEHICDVIVSKTPKELIKEFNIDSQRADILIGGIGPFKVLHQILAPDNVVISANGLREGVFFNQYPEYFCGKEWPIEEILNYSVKNVMNDYNINEIHSNHVTKMALTIFDQLEPLHSLGRETRNVLRIAGLLHDIGMHINVYNHHKHSAYLILNLAINGFRNRETVMCALMTLLHRNQNAKTNWRHYDMLIEKKDLEAVKICALFLRISEMLDRSETQRIKHLECIIENGSVDILIDTCGQECQLEIDAAIKSAQHFKKLLGFELNIKTKEACKDMDANQLSSI